MIILAIVVLAIVVLILGSIDDWKTKGRQSMNTEATKALELLGLKVRDRVTGFAVVSSVCFDLYGCIQAVVSPTVDDKGAMPDGKWIDVSRLEVVDASPVMEIPGGRFAVTRSGGAIAVPAPPGPNEKPAR